MKARIRNAGGTILFVLLGITLWGVGIFFLCSLFDSKNLEADELVLAICYICFPLTSGSILIMIATSLSLSDYYHLFGALFILMSLFCGVLSYTTEPVLIFVACLAGIEFGCGLVMFVPRSWPLAKYILPYRVVHIDQGLV